MLLLNPVVVLYGLHHKCDDFGFSGPVFFFLFIREEDFYYRRDVRGHHRIHPRFAITRHYYDNRAIDNSSWVYFFYNSTVVLVINIITIISTGSSCGM